MDKKELIKRIHNLNNREIDLLFYNCGWLEENDDGNLALPKFRIQKIKNGDFGIIDVFIFETPQDKILRELNKIEKIK